MKIYKSFLFLLILNLLFALPLWAFLGIKFLIPLFALLLPGNLFLIFFNYFDFNKKNFSFFTPDDPYQISQSFEELKKTYNVKNVQLLKIKDQTDPSFFYFAKGYKCSIAVSENLLKNFSKEDMQMLLSYVLRMIQTGDLFFLTILSGFLFLIERMMFYLHYPLSLLTRKPIKKDHLVLIFLLKTFSYLTKRIYKKMDKALASQKKGEKEQLAFLLWKLDSFAKVCPPKIPLFLAPLFLINPLTDSGWGCYISLHPLIRERLKSLSVKYPP